jgi:uncharacterized protein YggL (DUF469 family)
MRQAALGAASMNSNEPWLGFKIVYQLNPKLSVAEQDEIGWAFIAEAIEKYGLCYNGGGRTFAQGFAIGKYPASASEVQRQAVADWLARHPSVLKFEVGPLGESQDE